MTNPKLRAVVILKIASDDQDKYYLMSSPEGTVDAFDSCADACYHFEEGYRQAMAIGGNWPASAAINFLQFQPSVVEIESDEDVKSLVDIPFQNYALHSIAGLAHGIPCNANGEEAWKKGIKPRLV